MSNPVVIGFDDETAAFELRAELAKVQKEYLLKMENAVVRTKDENDKVHLHQAKNLTAAWAVGCIYPSHPQLQMIYLSAVTFSDDSGSVSACIRMNHFVIIPVIIC